MIAYMTHVFDELIGSPRANHYLAIVTYRFIQPLATSFAKPQPCERPHRASRVRIYTKYWQSASYSCRFTLKTLLSQSDYLPTDLPFFYTRIEEYIAPACPLVQHLTSESVTGSVSSMDYLLNSIPRCREQYRRSFQLVRMKICLYVIHTIKIYFPINTLLRKPNSSHYYKVVRQIYW